jgi:hypothetical protein
MRSPICTKIGRLSSIKYSIASPLIWLITHVTNNTSKTPLCQGFMSLEEGFSKNQPPHQKRQAKTLNAINVTECPFIALSNVCMIPDLPSL